MNGLTSYLLAGVMRLIMSHSFDDGSGVLPIAHYDVSVAQRASVQVVWCMPQGGCTALYNPELDVFEYAGPTFKLSVIPDALVNSGELSPFTNVLTE